MQRFRGTLAITEASGKMTCLGSSSGIGDLSIITRKQQHLLVVLDTTT